MVILKMSIHKAVFSLVVSYFAVQTATGNSYNQQQGYYKNTDARFNNDNIGKQSNFNNDVRFQGNSDPRFMGGMGEWFETNIGSYFRDTSESETMSETDFYMMPDYNSFMHYESPYPMYQYEVLEDPFKKLKVKFSKPKPKPTPVSKAVVTVTKTLYDHQPVMQKPSYHHPMKPPQIPYLHNSIRQYPPPHHHSFPGYMDPSPGASRPLAMDPAFIRDALGDYDGKSMFVIFKLDVDAIRKNTRPVEVTQKQADIINRVKENLQKEIGGVSPKVYIVDPDSDTTMVSV